MSSAHLVHYLTLKLRTLGRFIAFFAVLIFVMDSVLELLFHSRTRPGSQDRFLLNEHLNRPPWQDFERTATTEISGVGTRWDQGRSPSPALASQQAAREILDANFFYEGRGVHTSPQAYWAFELLGTDGGWKGRLFRDWVANKTGLIFDSGTQAVGSQAVTYDGVQVAVQSCATCHAGKVLGQVVPGLGNKNIDIHELASWNRTMHGYWPSWMTPGSESASKLEQQSIEMSDRLAAAGMSNLTQGMVSVSTIHAWMHSQSGRPPPSDLHRAAVKVPALWGLNEKRQAGFFCDGFADGRDTGWLLGVELAAGQVPEVVTEAQDKIAQMQQAFGRLLPPVYPLGLDRDLAIRGQTLFADNCQVCHGQYRTSRNGYPVFDSPRRIPIAIVDTDRDRLANNSAALFAAMENGPLADEMRISASYEHGYLAPRLEGIWARFPYLHNGSVPSIYSLLTPPDDRPRLFDLREAGEVHRFDPETLGLTVPPGGSPAAAELQDNARRNLRYVYDVSRIGHTNHGHDFGTELTKSQKRALIEFLKTL